MKLEVNLEKRYFVFLLIGILVVGGIVTVYAYNSGLAPSVFGHSAEEIEVKYDYKLVQHRVEACPSDTAIKSIAQDGRVNCINVRDSVSGDGGNTGGCTLLADLDGTVNQIAIDVPAECINNLCDMILSSKRSGSSVISAVAFFKFSQNVPGLGGGARVDQWSNGNIVGTNDGNAEEEIASAGGARVVDDHRFFPNSGDAGKILVLDGSDDISRLYICS